MAKDKEREAFLKALKKNEDDVTTRMVYADWLDERGEHEEADRQRKWPAAKAWLVAFAKRVNPGEDDDETMPVTYESLIEMGHEGLKEGAVECYNNMDLCYELQDNAADFWKNWSVVTGVPVSDDAADGMGYSCAC